MINNKVERKSKMSVRNLLTVNFDEEQNGYNIEIPSGSNLAETAFCMAAVIKCFVKDGIVENHTVVTDMINKYLTDPQYDELEENGEAEVPGDD